MTNNWMLASEAAYTFIIEHFPEVSIDRVLEALLNDPDYIDALNQAQKEEIAELTEDAIYEAFEDAGSYREFIE